MLEMRASGRDKVQDYADKFGVPFYPGEKPWNVKVDVVMPCATQNEIGMKEAEQIVANGIQYYIEVSNMPTTNEAMAVSYTHLTKGAGIPSSIPTLRTSSLNKSRSGSIIPLKSTSSGKPPTL